MPNSFLDKNLKTSQKDKRKAYVKFLRLRDSSSKTAYNCIKNHFERVIILKKQTFYESQLTTNQTSTKSVRKILNSLIGKYIFPLLLLIRDSLANDVIKEPSEIAESFNNRGNCVIQIISKLSIKAIKFTKRNLLQ